MTRDTPEKYGLFTKILHHAIAILMIFQFLKLFEHWNNKENFISSSLPPWHGSIGLILTLLISLRIIWSITQLRNRKVESKVAQIGHIMMYVFMTLTPITALMFMLGKGHAIKFFGNIIIPGGEGIPSLMILGNLHSPISIIFVTLVIGHIAMAIFHRLVKQDNVFQKMF